MWQGNKSYLEVNYWVVQETLFSQAMCGVAGKTAQWKSETTSF